jgi:predicted dehydrogenase
VLVEKPLALDGAAADAIVGEARRNGRTLMTAHVLRFLPDYVVLRDAVRAGQLGAARFATFRRRCAAPGWGGWLQDPSKSGGGVFDLLIHDVDMCLQLFGRPETVAATGVSDAARGIDCLDASLFYADRTAVSVIGGWHNPGAFPFSMEYTVTFDGGTIDFHSAGRPPTLYAADGAERALPRKDEDGYAAEIAYFVECCRTGREPDVCPPQESADAVKLMLLLLEARQRNGEKIPCRI